MDPEQDLESNSFLISVSFVRFAVASILPVTRLVGFVRHNSAGKFDKRCFSTSKEFNISDYLWMRAIAVSFSDVDTDTSGRVSEEGACCLTKPALHIF